MMIQSIGLSPRTPKQYREHEQQVAIESSTGQEIVTINKKGFFQEPTMVAVEAGIMEGSSARTPTWNKAYNRSPRSPTLLPSVSPRQHPRGSFSKLRAAAVHPKPITRSTVQILATVATVCAVVPWFCSRGLGGVGGNGNASRPAAVASRTSFRGLARAELSDNSNSNNVPTEHRCQSRAWADSMTADRGMCAPLLPVSVVESEGWLVAVHVDRHPSVAAAVVSSKATTLRGATKRPSMHRDLPHQYFVRAMEATLHGIATTEPGADVDIALFSEGRWGGIVDEMGVPVEWDVPHEICGDLGLHCTQTLVQLNEPASIPDALECISAADVFVSSESDFSQAAAVLATGVKVLTNKWEMDEDETMVALNPATTVAGMPKAQRQELRNVVSQWNECSRNAVAIKRP